MPASPNGAASAAMLNYTATTMADTAPGKKEAKKPRVRVVFMRTDVDRNYMGWPGASYD